MAYLDPAAGQARESGAGTSRAVAGAVAAVVRNETGSTIAAGSLVYISGWNETEGAFLITKADADAAGRKADFILRDAIATATTGVAYKTHRLTGQNTSAANAVGDPVYLDTTAGGWTLTAPSGADDTVQQVGVVAVDHASTGVIEFFIDEPTKVGLNELQDAALAASAAGRAIMADDFFDATTADAKFAAGAIGEDLLTANEITGRAMGNVANANVIGGIPVIHRITVADMATGNVDVVLTHKTRVLDVTVIATAAGHASEDTITVQNGTNPITDAIAKGSADKAVKRAGTIDDAFWDIAAAGTLRVSVVKGAGGGNNSACEVIVTGIRVA